MRKIVTVLVLLAMFELCTSSYGYLLVYKISTTIKGSDNNTGAVATVPLKGFLIMDPCNPAESNVIIYGNDANTPKKQKAYVMFYGGTFDAHNLDDSGKYVSLEFSLDNANFNMVGLIKGKLKNNVNVGPISEGLQSVAVSLKGVVCVWEGQMLGPISANRDVSGTSNISVTLWPLATKWANGADDVDPGQKTQQEVIEMAVDTILKGYIYAEPIL